MRTVFCTTLCSSRLLGDPPFPMIGVRATGPPFVQAELLISLNHTTPHADPDLLVLLDIHLCHARAVTAGPMLEL